jgi:enoyl-CoA hydratase/carnithine racemase
MLGLGRRQNRRFHRPAGSSGTFEPVFWHASALRDFAVGEMLPQPKDSLMRRSMRLVSRTQSFRTRDKETPIMTVTHEIDGAVGVVTLAKPPHNLLDDELLEGIAAAYRMVLGHGCRAILLRSSMRHFSAGADMASFGKTTVIHTDKARFEEIMSVLEDAPVPTVAAVHGGALGGGLELALSCDMIICADTASLGQVECSVGLMPLLGGTQRIVQRAGLARANEIVMLGRRYTPQAFERWGIVNLVVPEKELPAASMTLARQLASGPTAVLKGAKRLARLAARGGVAAADAHQADINNAIWDTADRERGIAAFYATGPATAVFKGD